ncbi:RNA polymerase sigma factor [Pontibacter sp. SGAir0037]|uniref:RNA polymerase sigma factor n=1 Tax=Pontibacter sp. SGAir0037 TaxID=2571030 RepID=UPI0010CD411F|nr:sigma-70 family RNA polymerase sigma factor [Pontibacter sp. SGAir0037]QCR21005.1 hypothetical protein C1N53_00575 [Pontibacter sp. SGAir0037]
MKDNTTDNSELSLWLAFKRGDEETFIAIYQKYVNVLYKYGTQITSDQDLVKDCIQSLFIELWDRRERLGNTDSIKFYLFKSLKRKIVEELMAQQKKVSMSALEEGYRFDLVMPFEQKLIVSQAESEQKQKLSKVLEQLTKRQREAIYLYFYNEMTYEEVAALMSLKVASVYDLISDGLKKLRSSMNKIDFMYAWLLFMLLRFSSLL